MKLRTVKFTLFSLLMMFSVAMMAQSKANATLSVGKTAFTTASHPDIKVVKVYPNPTPDYLIIEGGQANCPSKQCLIAEVVDLNGEIVIEEYVDLSTGVDEIDLTGLDDQLYFLRIYNQDQSFTFEERIQKGE
ncbi:MAG: T9SS type A sorting domain-containing protein [Bacteroidota bacterium]